MNGLLTLKTYGWDGEWLSAFSNQSKLYAEETRPARISAVHRELFHIVTEHGEKCAKLKTSLFYNETNPDAFPTVGDYVAVMPNPAGDDLICGILPRRSKFARLDSWHGTEQLVAANFDYVFITLSLNEDFNLKRLERYLTLAWQSGGTPVVLLTKADLRPDYEHLLQQARQVSAEAGRTPSEVLAISAVTGLGLDALHAFLQAGKTVVCLGSSGVGKSTMINALSEQEVMKVSGIRDDDGKGRHTTTHRQLLMLPGGGIMIDTPGMREIGMWRADEGIDVMFGDVEALVAECRFADCTHQKEPGCAVRKALASGRLPRARWDNYCGIKKEALYAARKELHAQIKQKGPHKKYSRKTRGTPDYD